MHTDWATLPVSGAPESGPVAVNDDLYFRIAHGDDSNNHNMSFMLEEEDKLATLDELFAFIECSGQCTEGDDYFGDDTGGKSPLAVDGSSALSEGDCCLPDSPDKPPKRRRKRTGWSSSTGLQRRKRAELHFLRQHVLHLESYLQQLKLPPTTGIDISKDAPSQEHAMAEPLKRVQSEEINRMLKTIMNNQLQIHDALKNVFEYDEDRA
ncbi:hypothetical protein PF005_g20273 [Phytophthora fragariae]|uniref:Uncharacterized protein n=1 Tax=Phytophthora fragariae TaxID=53985 RepID=A0A6A3E513_9STRA|nr:hypothetical protein PF003_g36907 [Phytophthora fragariae]KAE8928872.1 hypothetical protein PF009_g20996 [Phytophthora fragariae]KAE8982890.1 hypothetical protein PF011_g21424 [Phytophthora fragariae]KAE9081056.1 hypothetical protein PF007_g22805 [Phytophthora fragariae]KAE9104198.1 hypothetical protein PF006_g21975 [Phytophthora fragariae]